MYTIDRDKQVRKVVANCRYAPAGVRGIGPMIPTLYGNHDMKEYVDTARHAIFVSVMIETPGAAAEIEEICGIEGLDSITVGPGDLSLAMTGEVNPSHPDVMPELERIISTARNAGKFVGAGQVHFRLICHCFATDLRLDCDWSGSILMHRGLTRSWHSCNLSEACSGSRRGMTLGLL